MNIEHGKYWGESLNPVKIKGGGYHCTKISPGCQNCWAERMNLRFHNKIPYYSRGVEFVLDNDVLMKPIKRKKPTVYFVQDMSDLFHKKMLLSLTDKVLNMIAYCSHHKFLILTKRPEYLPIYNSDISKLKNLYLGLTICNQQEADEKLPVFMKVPGNKILSLEPMLGGIEIPIEYLKRFKVVIVGGESGPGARPMNPEWVRSVRDQCQDAGVPFFFKQWGNWMPTYTYDIMHGIYTFQDLKRYTRELIDNIRLSKHQWDKFNLSIKIGKKQAGRLLDRVEHNDLPWGNDG